MAAPGHRKRWHYSATELLGVLLLLFLVTPLLHALPKGDYFEEIVGMLVMASAVPAVGSRWRVRFEAFVLGLLALVMRLLEIKIVGFPSWLFPLCCIVFCGFVIFHLLRSVVYAKKPDSRVISAAICGYFFIGFLFAFLFLLVERWHPGSFSIGDEEGLVLFNAAYFSFITLSTIGYGDVLPLSVAARSYAVLESTIGLFYCTVLVARLVSLYRRE